MKKGYSNAQLEDLRKLVYGEDSELFDILNYAASIRNAFIGIQGYLYGGEAS